MPSIETLIFISGILHLGTLLGSAQVPKEMNFKEELPKVTLLLRHWILVAGAYIVLNLIAFGLISLTLAGELASGSPLARKRSVDTSRSSGAAVWSFNFGSTRSRICETGS